MLKDRKEYIEHEIKTKTHQAGLMYLQMIQNFRSGSKEYDYLVADIQNLEFDLKMVNDLIEQGHQ